MINYRKYLDKRGSATGYVLVLLGTLILLFTFVILNISKNNNMVKIKDDLTKEEILAVKNIENTLDDITNLPINDTISKDVVVNGKLYTIEVRPTGDIEKKKVTKEYDLYYMPVDSSIMPNKYYSYFYDWRYNLNTQPYDRRERYSTVPAIRKVVANNNTNNQSLMFSSNGYKKTFTDNNKNNTEVRFRGLVNSPLNISAISNITENNTILNNLPNNFIQSSNTQIHQISGIKRVIVTKDKEEKKEVANYPTSLVFPFNTLGVGFYEVEYLDSNNNVMYWHRFHSNNESNRILSYFHSKKSFNDSYNDFASGRDIWLKSNDISVDNLNNIFVISEVPNKNVSLTETLQNTNVDISANTIMNDLGSTSALHVEWDYEQSCVREKVLGYPITGELITTSKALTNLYDNSLCEQMGRTATYDVSLDEHKSGGAPSFPIYTNWSNLNRAEIEGVFNYYKHHDNVSDLHKCIKGSGEDFCASQNKKGNVPAPVFNRMSRQDIKEYFLFCDSEGFSATVADANERWLRFINRQYDLMYIEMDKIANELKAYYGATEVERLGEKPPKPVVTFDATGSNSISKNIALLKSVKFDYYMNSGVDQGLIDEAMKDYIIGDGSDGLILFDKKTGKLTLANFGLANVAVARLGINEKIAVESTKEHMYSVPCAKGFNMQDENYKMYPASIPYMNFNLDILTNTETDVKITVKHRSAFNNANTSYSLTFDDAINNSKLYHQDKVNSKDYSIVDQVDSVKVKANYANLDFADLGHNLDLRTNRLQFRFTSANRVIDKIKVEYDVIKNLKYSYHIYNEVGELIHYEEKIKDNGM